jgi:uncharacterized integral membrane protein (TIGR00698 family)
VESALPRQLYAAPPWQKWLARIVLIGGAIASLFGVSVVAALLAGIVFALVFRGASEEIGVSRYATLLLKASVVGLGAGMNLLVVWQVGVEGAGYTLVSIALTLAFGIWLGRTTRLSSDLALLVAVGTAICGGSAIAAVAVVIRSKPQDTTLALTIVFLLNAVALVIFPPLGHLIGFSQREFGIWSALAIYDTSSVVGAAMSYGKEALAIATTVKLTRALWIVPVAFAAGYLGSRPASPDAPARRRLPIPLFIVGFIAMAAIFTYAAPLAAYRAPVANGARHLFAATLFLIGAGFSIHAVRSMGLRLVAFALILWTVIAAATAEALKLGWIR